MTSLAEAEVSERASAESASAESASAESASAVCSQTLLEFIAKSSKRRNFCKSSQISVIAAKFSQILGLDASRGVITMRI